MTQQGRFPRSILGSGFREGFVAGLVEDVSSVPNVLGALARGGFVGEDVRVFAGETALQIDASHHPSLASAPCSPGEADASQEFIAGALLGDVLVGVRAGSEAPANDAARILIGEGVDCVHQFVAGVVRRPQELAGSTA